MSGVAGTRCKGVSGTDTGPSVSGWDKGSVNVCDAGMVGNTSNANWLVLTVFAVSLSKSGEYWFA